jgi:DNA-binding transcriptional LysR family regulator
LVDFDLAQVRAFVAVADHEHFGRAAVGLHLTQQATSRRIQRLEQLLGAQLFVRGVHRVGLTPEGARFLPFARQLISQADAALAAVTGIGAPLRVDVWSYLRLGPLQLVDEFTDLPQRFPIEVSMRRNLWSAMEAIRRGELDVAFGRVHDLAHPWPGELCKCLVQLEPTAVIVNARHRRAGETAIRPRDLASSTLWAPPVTTAPEFLSWFERFAHDFHLSIHYQKSSKLPDIGDGVAFAAAQPDNIAIVPVQSAPVHKQVTTLLLTAPVPRMPWSIVWRRDDRNPVLAQFLHRVTETSTAQHRNTLDPEADWIPEPDRADITPAKPSPGHHTRP